VRRVLITGGSGFVGTHLAAALATHPDVGHLVSADVRAPQHPLDGVVYEDCDITRPVALAALLRTHAVDVVVHLASAIAPLRDTTLEYRVEVEGSRHVIDACLETGVRRIVVASSGAAYGYHADNPPVLRETDPLRGNDDLPHALRKRLVEEMLESVRARHPELEQVVFRVGTILGPAVGTRLTALWDGPRIFAVRGWDSPFGFIWVDDVAAAMVRAATDGPPGIYNLTGAGTMTVAEIAERLGKPRLTVPAGLLEAGVRIGRMLGLTRREPEEIDVLRHRPVLAVDALHRDFGFTPARSTREAFEAYLATHPTVSHR
jgi:UDP-glucose 4-epimerase